MANCEICGKPVMTSKVWHAACWEKEMDKMAQVFCDDYCRWTRECRNEDEFEEHCDNCPIIRVVNMGM